MKLRNWPRDIGLAVLLAAPTLALARPQPTVPQHVAAQTPAIQQIAFAERTSARRLAPRV